MERPNRITLKMKVWRGQTQINTEKLDFSCFVTHFPMGEHSTAHRAAQEKHGSGRGWNCGQAPPLCFVWKQKCEEGEAGLGMANWNISSCLWGLGCLWFSGIWSWGNYGECIVSQRVSSHYGHIWGCGLHQCSRRGIEWPLARAWKLGQDMTKYLYYRGYIRWT